MTSLMIQPGLTDRLIEVSRSRGRCLIRDSEVNLAYRQRGVSSLLTSRMIPKVIYVGTVGTVGSMRDI